LKRVPLLFPFFLALIASFGSTVFFPHTRLHTFAPFLALLYSRCSRLSSLWIGSLCGLCLDALGSEALFGLHSLSFAVATLLLYRQKKHFYSDKPLALSLFTFQISLIITSVLFLFTCMSSSSPRLHLKWLLSDFLVMSFFDSIYALLWFSIPMLLYARLSRFNLRSFLNKISFRMNFLKRKKDASE
jgi:rod shape-determining protein MreD